MTGVQTCALPIYDPIPRSENNGIVDTMDACSVKAIPLFHRGGADSGTDDVSDTLSHLLVPVINDATMVDAKPVYTVKIRHPNRCICKFFILKTEFNLDGFPCTRGTDYIDHTDYRGNESGDGHSTFIEKKPVGTLWLRC